MSPLYDAPDDDAWVEHELDRLRDIEDERAQYEPDEPPPTLDEFRAWASEEDQERREFSEHGPVE